MGILANGYVPNAVPEHGEHPWCPSCGQRVNEGHESAVVTKHVTKANFPHLKNEDHVPNDLLEVTCLVCGSEWVERAFDEEWVEKTALAANA